MELRIFDEMLAEVDFKLKLLSLWLFHKLKENDSNSHFPNDETLLELRRYIGSALELIDEILKEQERIR